MKTTHKFYIIAVIALLLIAMVALDSMLSFGQVKTTFEARKHNSLVLDKANALFFSLKDAETGQRGYLLTGDDNFLEPYLTMRDRIAGDLNQLSKLTKISAAKDHLVIMAPLIEAKMQELKRLIDLRRDGSVAFVAAEVSKGKGKRLMDAIRTEIATYIQIENDALVKNDEKLESKSRHMFNMMLITSLLWILFAIALIYLIYRQSQQKLKNLVHEETRHLLEVQEGTNKQLLQLNATLQDREEKLSVTLNSIGDAVITTDAEARVTLLNPLAEQLTGWTLAEVTGRQVTEIFHIINKETRLASTIPVLATLANGTIQGMANHKVLIARDGSECDIADSCAPIRDLEGQIIGTVLLLRDVTKEYLAQQALRDNAVFIKTILNTVADGIITLHASNGIIETANTIAQQMFGFSATELSGLNFSVLIPELDQEQRNSSIKHYSPTEEARVVGLGREVIGWRKGNKPFPLEIAVTEMWLGDERYFTCILRDITVRSQSEAERIALNKALELKNVELERATAVAERANLAKSDFLSSMSHELRTPLGAILGFAQLIESGLPVPTSAQKKSIDQILKAGWYLLELINEVLDLALIESGKLDLSLEPVLLADLMHECEAMIEQQAQSRNIKVMFTQPEFPYCVKGDRTRVKQIIINLLSNAIKYNQVNGSVTVESRLAPYNRVRISVRDTGAGLTVEQLTQLFQPFNRLGQHAKDEGTGIGLVVCKRLIGLMKGNIGVESIVGEGSTFWFELDQANQSQIVDTLQPELQVQQQVHTDTQTYRLLYVEDNPANLMLVEEIIARRPDIRFLSAKNARQGIKLARAALPDVILMDINLPGFSGYDALNMLLDDPLTAHIPVVALSANAMPRDIEKGLEAGFFRYLTKPIKVIEFMETMDLVLKFAKNTAAV
jgi:PAS domain S-box-containing protein